MLTNLNNNTKISFNDCKFINNIAEKGGISYTYSIDYVPYFSNFEELKNIDNAIVTNPSHLKLTENSLNFITMLSGETVKNKISFLILDEYDNVMNDKSLDNISDFIFFKVELNDTYNTKLISQSDFYCDVGICEVSSLKVVGNPGNYELYIKLNNFGNYNYFSNSVIKINITIEECNDIKYLYQDIENIGLKSCYLPECDIGCNGGTCVNINVCNCTNTLYKGLYCNEYNKLNRISLINIIAIIISIILILIIGASFVGTVIYKNKMVFKIANFEFMTIVLIGMLINCIYVIVLTFEKKIKLYLLYELFL